MDSARVFGGTKMNHLRLSNLAIVFFIAVGLSGCGKRSPEPGTVKDEALAKETDGVKTVVDRLKINR